MSDAEIALERLTAWVREYGDSKPQVFVGDVSMLLAIAKGAMSKQAAGGWTRTTFTSIWRGPDIELIVVQNAKSENWQWTARGWRQPDDIDSADKWGWCETAGREDAEALALAFYLEKDE